MPARPAISPRSGPSPGVKADPASSPCDVHDVAPFRCANCAYVPDARSETRSESYRSVGATVAAVTEMVSSYRTAASPAEREPLPWAVERAESAARQTRGRRRVTLSDAREGQTS